MKKCPHCKGDIAERNVRREFSCPHCATELTSNFVSALFFALVTAALIGLPIRFECGLLTESLCSISIKLVAAIIGYFAVYRPLLTLKIKKPVSD
jgi:hypothetical protein